MSNNIPLYAEAYNSPPSYSSQANQGLWFDKFCNTWKDDFSGLVKAQEGIEEGKKAWISSVAKSTAGDPSILDEAQKRMKRLCEAHNGIIGGFHTEGPFVTGLGRNHPVENGFAWHYSYGVPYLPGSSVKGMVRAWAETWDTSLEDEQFLRIFGSPRKKKGEPQNVGSVIFMDALPMRSVKLCVEIMTPHYSPWYSEGEVPGDWYSPVPIPFLAVAEGESFQFGIMPRRPEDENSIQNCRTAFEWLVAALEWIGAGAKTAVGYGRMRQEVEKKSKLVWSNATLRWTPGNTTLTVTGEGGKKVMSKLAGDRSIVPESMHEQLFERKKAVAAKVTVKKEGNLFQIVRIDTI